MRIVLHIHGEIQNQIMGMTRLIATDSWSGKLMKAKLGQWSRQRKMDFKFFAVIKEFTVYQAFLSRIPLFTPPGRRW